MSPHFTIELLGVHDGDCLWVEWGHDSDRRRMLIDGGRSGDRNMASALAERFRHTAIDERVFDLVVCTHMDADHINGLVPLFRTPPEGFVAKEVWFNAFRHLPDDVLGVDKADELARILDQHRQVWNTTFDAPPNRTPRRAASISDAGSLPVVDVGGMKLTILSPDEDKLRALRREWPQAVQDAGLDPALASPLPVGDVLGFRDDAGVPLDELARRPFIADTKAPNGSSIAFLAEFAGKQVLFGADAHADIIEGSLRRLQPSGPIALAACKLSHHGSAANLSPELVAMLDTPRWLISTSGSIHHHPDRRAIARLLARRQPAELIFNYRTDTTSEWARPSVQQEWGFTAFHPDVERPGVLVDVLGGRASVLPDQ